MRRLLLALALLLGALPAAAEGLAGRLLVASPAMPDGPFSATVILVCRHDAQGAFGLVVNRRAGHAEAETGFPLRLGGPVEPNLLFLLMTAETPPAAGLVVPGGLAVVNPAPYLAGEKAPPRRASLMVGYSGWGAGQLEAEIANGDWLVQDFDEETVFGDNEDAKWRRAMGRRSIGL